MRNAAKIRELLVCVVLCLFCFGGANAAAVLNEAHGFERLSRVWIDTDAACGGRFKDVDDCLAIAMMLSATDVTVVGVGTVFGNADIGTTHSVTAGFVAEHCFGSCPVVYRGAASANTGATPASRALTEELAKGPLLLLMLGPVSNLAAAIGSGLDLAQHRVVAVAGTRWRSATFSVRKFWPVRLPDLNFVKDPDGFDVLLRAGASITLVPFEAAQKVQFSAAHIRHLDGVTGLTELAGFARHWLRVWRIGLARNAFYPFDAVAALFVLEAGQGFTCLPGHAARSSQGNHRSRWPTGSRRTRSEYLFVDTNSTVLPNVQFCSDVPRGAGQQLLKWLSVAET